HFDVHQIVDAQRGEIARFLGVKRSTNRRQRQGDEAGEPYEESTSDGQVHVLCLLPPRGRGHTKVRWWTEKNTTSRGGGNWGGFCRRRYFLGPAKALIPSAGDVGRANQTEGERPCKV